MSTSSPKWSRKSARRAGGASAALPAVVLAALLAGCGDPAPDRSSGGGGNDGGVAWGAPATLAADLLQAGAPAAAIDDAGLAAVLWSQPDGGTPSRPAVFARLRAAADWADAEQIEAPLASDDSGADLVAGLQATAPDSGISALWARQRPSAGDLLRSAAREANGWSLQSVPAGVGVTVTEPVFAANDAGVQAAAWVQEVAGVRQVVLNTRRLGAGGVSWATVPLPVQTDPAAVGSQPALAVDAAGTVMIVWRQGSGPGRLFSRSYSVPQGSFGLQLDVHPQSLPNDVRSPRVVALAAGVFLASWEQADGNSGAYGLLAKQGTVAAWAVDPSIIDAQADSVTASLLLAGPTQSAIAVWQQGTALFVARRPGGGLWSVPVPVGAGLAGTPSALRAAADASGNAIAVWLQQPTPGAAQDLYFALLPASNTPLAPALLESGAGSASAPALAMNAAGAALVAWLQPATGQVNPSLVARVAR